MSKIVLFGTGRGADVAYRFLSADTDHEIVAFAVDDAHRQTDTLRGLPVVAFEEVETLYPPRRFPDACSVGIPGHERPSATEIRCRQGKRLHP